MTKVRDRLADFYLCNGDCTQNDPAFCSSGGCSLTCSSSNVYINTIRSDFTWANINYTDDTRNDWNTSAHLSRVVGMARSFRCVQCESIYNNQTVLSLISGATSFWLTRDFHNPNWWWNGGSQ